MIKFLKIFERYIIIGLLGMMMMVVFLGAVELVIVLVSQMMSPPRLILLDINEMLTIFGFFMMILIGLELMETIKVYLVEQKVHVEIIFLVAIIAITRKIIILDIKEIPPLTVIGVAALVLALSVGFFALKRALNGDAGNRTEEAAKK